LNFEEAYLKGGSKMNREDLVKETREQINDVRTELINNLERGSKMNVNKEEEMNVDYGYTLLSEYCQRQHIKVVPSKTTFYDPKTDTIGLASTEQNLVTAFAKVCLLSTYQSPRLGLYGEEAPLEDNPVFEELIAEIGTISLCHVLGTRLSIEDSHVKSLLILFTNKEDIFARAIRIARGAVGYILRTIACGPEDQLQNELIYLLK
jgi:hypothetical protein